MLLPSSKQQHRLAAIAAFTALIYTETESMHARAQRTSNAFRLLFQTQVSDIATAKAAAAMVGALSDLNSALCARAVDHVLTNAINLIGHRGDKALHPELSADRARSAMVITELAGVDKAPAFVLRFQEKLRRALWDVVWDSKRSVREQGVMGLQSILKTVIIRAHPNVIQEAMNDVMQTIRETLSSNSNELQKSREFHRLKRSDPLSRGFNGMAVIHGSLSMVASLLSWEETIPYMTGMSTELCRLSLRFQKSSDADVRKVVAEVLPLLVKLDREVFEGHFLHEVHESTMELVNNRTFPAEERGQSLVSLAAITEQMSGIVQDAVLQNMLKVCKQTLYEYLQKKENSLIPVLAVLRTVSHLAKASRGCPIFIRAMRDGLLSLMFSTEFTNDLVQAVDDVGRAVPSLQVFIRERLANLVAATLKIRMYGPNATLSMKARGPPRRPRDSCSTDELLKNHLPSRPSMSALNGSAMDPKKNGTRVHGSQNGASLLSPQDFFKQYPFSTELHRIDSGAMLDPSPSANTLEGLLKSPSDTQTASALNDGLLKLPALEADFEDDFRNSPCVALKALVNYELSGMSAQDFCSFANEFVIGYVESISVKVRALAVAACSKLMECAATVWASSRDAGRLSTRLRPEIQSILAQLLLLSVGDPSTDVRYVAIRSLDKAAFYPYLLQPEMLSTLFMCFYDGSLGMKNASLSLAGRLSDLNPAHILPALRRYLMHLLTTLKLDGDYYSRDRLNATKLIYTLVHNSRSLVEPYTNSLMDALLIRLQDAKRSNDTNAALPVLLTIAELGGTMGRIDMKPYRPALVPLIVSSVLQVQSAEPTFQKAALRALAAIVQNTGFVIKPYDEHPALLSGLINLLRNETDSSVRLEAEMLIGSLGAVDPDDHKYAALPMFLGSRADSPSRPLTSASQSRSMYRIDLPYGLATSQWGAPSSNLGYNFRGPSQRLSGSSKTGRNRQSNVPLENRGAIDSRGRATQLEYERRSPSSGDGRLGFAEVSVRPEDVNTSLSIFALGGQHIARLNSYTPVWDTEELENISLVGQLDHPYTASPYFFPSVALDALHTIIGNSRLRKQYREACQAIVNILKSVGPKCTYFLPAVVPRMLWLLAHSSRTEARKGLSFTQLQQQIMTRLGDVIGVAEHNFLPYAFDTVLLAWYFLQNLGKSPACVVSVCHLLSRLRAAIGDEFKPIIATVLPPLLSALVKDRSGSGESALAILRTLYSLSNLFDDYGVIVLGSITKVAVSQRPMKGREQALAHLIVIIEDMPSVEILPCVMHPLIQILAGVGEELPVPEDFDEDEVHPAAHEMKFASEDTRRLTLLAGHALLQIGLRPMRGYDVFVAVIAKALKCSRIKETDEIMYRSLARMLLERNPDVVSEILGMPPSELSTHQSLPNIREVLRSNVSIADELAALRRGRLQDRLARLPAGTRKPLSRPHVLESALVQKWEVEHNFSSDDWVKWMSSLGAAMFEQSGAPAFRACVRISESYPQFSQHLFDPAFLSCWTYPLSQPTKSKICGVLEKALCSDTIPLNVLQALLELYEFMDHDEKPLPAGTDKLASTACKCGAHAKAVRYREKDYSQHLGKPDELEQDITGEHGLIAIYEKLGHIDSAVGTITHFQTQTRQGVKEKWYEELRRWPEALSVYEKASCDISDLAEGSLYEDKEKWHNTLGRLRCLNEIGEWRKTFDLLQDARRACLGNMDALRELALDGKGVSVTLDLGRWTEFEEWVGYLSQSTYQGCFYNILLLVRRGREDPSYLNKAEDFLYKARCKLDLELTARVSEGYPRAYTSVVEAQLLVELEEMIAYLRMPRQDADLFGRRRLHEVWDQRLRGCKHDRATWYRLLMIRALVMQPNENKAQWLDFAAMCRKEKLLPMASEALRMLLNSTATRDGAISVGRATSAPEERVSTVPGSFENWPIGSAMAIEDLDIKFATMKYLWAINRRVDAYSALERCGGEFLEAAGLDPSGNEISAAPASYFQRERVLAGEVFSKLSKWGGRLLESEEVQDTNLIDPLLYADRATKIRPGWYKAWHYWGSMNASRFEELIDRQGKRPTTRYHLGNGMRLGHREKTCVVRAVQGYFRAIELGGKTKLEDCLKLLNLWFNYGGLANLHIEFDKGFEETNIAMWLEVVPQIIARLYTPFPEVQEGVRVLLTRIGSEHPHVAVYPLTVAKGTMGSHQQKRSQAASEILLELKRHHDEIVEQAEMVSRELVRVAVLWTEKWYESLEEASKLFFVNCRIEEMLNTLLPLHTELEKGPETLFEQNFIAEFGRELQEAGDLCRKFRYEHRTGRADDQTLRNYLLQAWCLYHQVFRRIQRQQQSMLVLDLAHVSRDLHDASGLMLAVPGTYRADENVPVVGIQSFSSRLNVIQSKQRPRKLSITGSDGNEYQFLLKGHEDLRQDERVMQVFRLINKLFLKGDYRNILSNVLLKVYAVIALSADAGLIEWVPDCDTMHALVKEYREVRKIMPNIEHKVMLRIAPEPDRLPLLHKVDLFQFMLANTGGFDIQKVLWLKSRNSEMWLDRRTMYAKSLATTSMTGYLLGLGDRHPSNLMIERSTGKIMHIDFGDCFEVAMKREKYPEKVPFRLTRMLVEALEPCGVDGYFRHTSEATMDLLRQKGARESLMSMMEAFVYDPLIRWKLIGVDELVQIRNEEAASRRNTARARREQGNAANGHPNGVPMQAGPDAPTGESDIVRSLRETGSLSASLRQLTRAERRRDETNASESQYPGAIPTPSSSTHAQAAEEEDVDPANLQTPNERARIEQQRMLREGDPAHMRITHVSNEKAEEALSRFSDKLLGRDFDPDMTLSVPEQVDRLIHEAQSIEHLCALFLGWCAFW